MLRAQEEEHSNDIGAYRYRINQLEVKVANLETEAKERETARQAQDRANLMKGIIFLGAVVTTLGGIVWANLSSIIGR